MIACWRCTVWLGCSRVCERTPCIYFRHYKYLYPKKCVFDRREMTANKRRGVILCLSRRVCVGGLVSTTLFLVQVYPPPLLWLGVEKTKNKTCDPPRKGHFRATKITTKLCQNKKREKTNRRKIRKKRRSCPGTCWMAIMMIVLQLVPWWIESKH